MLQMFTAFAEFERSRIAERTTEGLARAKAEGVKLGRRPALETAERVQALKEEGLSQSRVALVMGISARTVKRHWHA